jgi:hypothetical protein
MCGRDHVLCSRALGIYNSRPAHLFVNDNVAYTVPPHQPRQASTHRTQFLRGAPSKARRAVAAEAADGILADGIFPTTLLHTRRVPTLIDVLQWRHRCGSSEIKLPLLFSGCKSPLLEQAPFQTTVRPLHHPIEQWHCAQSSSPRRRGPCTRRHPEGAWRQPMYMKHACVFEVMRTHVCISACLCALLPCLPPDRPPCSCQHA